MEAPHEDEDDESPEPMRGVDPSSPLREHRNSQVSITFDQPHSKEDEHLSPGQTHDLSNTAQPTQYNEDEGLSTRQTHDASNTARPTQYNYQSAPLGEPSSVGYDHSHDLTFDHSFLTFDEFAHNVLADSSYFSYEHGPSILGNTPDLPATTPLESVSYDTPQTANATTIVLPGNSGFEVTPVVERAVHLFFEHLYPTYPLIDQASVLGWLETSNEISKSDQVLVWSMCACTLVMVDSWPNLGNEQRAVSARRFIRKCRQLRLEWDYEEKAAFHDVLASLFIAIAFFDLKCRKASWSSVREALTLANMAGLNDGRAPDIDDHEQVRRQRAYALLYITERGASTLDTFPVSIFAPPPLPGDALPGEDPTIIAGLSALHSLFCLLDFKFVKIWNDQMRSSFEHDREPAANTYSDISLLQMHLKDLRINRSGLSDIQRADVLITQQWLRLVFWQAALKLGYISTAAADRAFTYEYPIDIAMSMCEVVKSLPPIAIQVHGLGIFEKQFEVAYSLMDTLALSGTTQPEHHECLRYLLLSLSASPNSRQIYVKTLEKKMGGSQKYRSLGGVELLRDDGASRHGSRRQSIAPPIHRS